MLQMLNARLGEIARQPDAPFLGAAAGNDTLGRTVEGVTIGARVNDGAITKGLTALAQEIARVRQFGFGTGELDRARAAMLASCERSSNERTAVQSDALASELLRHYLTREAAPGIERELALARQFLSTITTAEAGAMARELFGDDNRWCWRRHR